MGCVSLGSAGGSPVADGTDASTHVPPCALLPEAVHQPERAADQHDDGNDLDEEEDDADDAAQDPEGDDGADHGHRGHDTCASVTLASCSLGDLRLYSQTQCYVPAMAAEASLRERRRSLLAQPDLRGDAFCRAYAAEADAWLSGLADRAAGETDRHLALLAVGGYGRSSLCPYSDLDVVLVHAGHRDIKAVADAIWYPVWDEGVHLDHSVRRPAEVLSAAADDVRVALGLLDARLVWGEPKVADPLLAKARAAWRDRLGTRYLPDLEAQMGERHARGG